jgi:chromosome segregation ATPase
MDYKSVLNKRYQDLCQDLGHSVNNLEKLEAHIKTVKEEINAINETMGVLNAMQAEEVRRATQQSAQDEVIKEMKKGPKK